MEIEAKFDVTDASVARVLSTEPDLGPFRMGPPARHQVTDQYLDTAQRDCFRHGYDCRVRVWERGALVTLKGRDQGALGTFRRAEIEQELPSATCDPSLWPAGPARDLVQRLCQGSPLVPILTIRQERLERTLFDGDREVGRLSVDHVRPVLAGIERSEYVMVEVELGPRGTETDLLHANMALRSLPGLLPATQSKFARAFALLEKPAELSPSAA
ncbi:MAG TPA: CYTH domain-containing protein [Dehalococcoidia bacterium]|nr:CYTH domain-containing protein [Dehalococcoidia bacterium]